MKINGNPERYIFEFLILVQCKADNQKMKKHNGTANKSGRG